MEIRRCSWAKSEPEIKYHDFEWGKPQHDDKKLFELLILEGMQAGLSWKTILNKRENMRKAFDGFAPEVIAGYTSEKKEELLLNAGIIRNRAKINALVTNAQNFIKIQEEYGSFDCYIWSFTNGKQIVNQLEKQEEMPVSSEISDRMSKDLTKKGFKFVGTIICYSLMQAIGMVNDHMVWCTEYKQCENLQAVIDRPDAAVQ